jgi:hypothetical protein
VSLALTLAVFRWGALGSQKIQGFTARAFDLEGLVNAVAEFLAAGAAPDVVHLISLIQARITPINTD